MIVLAEEMAVFQNNQSRLSKWYPNCFLVIKEQQVYGGFPSIREAYDSALGKFEWGTFLVIKTLPPSPLPSNQKQPVKTSYFILQWLSSAFSK